MVCLIVIPASVALFVLAGPLTVAIYHYGKFTAFDVDMTRYALMAFSFALLGWSLIKVLATGYYARQDTRGPVRVAMWSLGLTMALNVVVLAALAITGHLESPGTHALLALSNGIGALLNAALLYGGLKRKKILEASAVGALVVRILIASAAMAALLVWLGGDVATWLAAPTIKRVVWLGSLVAGGVAVYFGVLWLLGVRPREFRLQPPAISA